MSTWQRIRFRVSAKSEGEELDPRPVKFPPSGPYWISGYGLHEDDREFAVLVAYAPSKEDLLEHWPDADLEWDGCDVQGRDEIAFTDRFPKPDWWS
jgi:hypothetical protein